MLLWEITFWCAAFVVAYAYLLYPLGVALLVRLRGRPPRARADYRASLSIVLAVFNEEERIAARLRELGQLLTSSGCTGEILVVSDGSTDRTVELVRGHDDARVRLLELPANVGKAAALTQAVALAQGEIVVCADVRQRWAEDALRQLLAPFADPAVGAVSGALMLESSPGVLAGVGLYWRFEKWLRQQESLLHSQVGVTGAICAVRRQLFTPLPQGIVLDDVYWPLCVTMQGYRVVLAREARAFDRLPDSTRGELRRKVRTLSGNFQLVARLPQALLPWRNPVWLQLVSHKLARLAVPWALLLLLLAAVLLLPAPWYAALLGVQLVGYGLALLGLWPPCARRLRILGTAASFLVLNTAAWLAFWTWISGRTGRSWRKASYSKVELAEVARAQASLPAER